MKVIVVSGARSKVGKTELTRALCGQLPGAVRIKIGHGSAKQGGDGFFYHSGTLFETIAAEHGSAVYLVIESNSILKQIVPDCTIYLSSDNPKPSAIMAREKADILRGELLPGKKVLQLAKRLKCGEKTVRKIAALANARLE
jgi:hypothetical protein